MARNFTEYLSELRYYLQSQGKSYFQVVLFISLLCVVMTVPTLFSIVYLVAIYLGVLFKARYYVKIMPLLLFYSFLATTLHYAFNIPTVMGFISDPKTQLLLQKIGFKIEQEFSPISFFLEFTLGFFIASTFRFAPTHVVAVQTSDENSEEKDSLLVKRVDQQLGAATARKVYKQPATARSIRHYTSNPYVHSVVSVTLKVLKYGYRIVRAVFVLLFMFIITNSYYATLCGLYFANMAAKTADLFHAIYRKFIYLIMLFNFSILYNTKNHLLLLL